MRARTRPVRSKGGRVSGSRQRMRRSSARFSYLFSAEDLRNEDLQPQQILNMKPGELQPVSIRSAGLVRRFLRPDDFRLRVNGLISQGDMEVKGGPRREHLREFCHQTAFAEVVNPTRIVRSELAVGDRGLIVVTGMPPPFHFNTPHYGLQRSGSPRPHAHSSLLPPAGKARHSYPLLGRGCQVR